MGCLLIIFSIFTPRIVLVLLYFFTNFFSQAYQTVIWPLLGFIFMPYTTLAYMAAMIYNYHNVNGLWLLLVIIAVLVDLGGQGGAARRR